MSLNRNSDYKFTDVNGVTVDGLYLPRRGEPKSIRAEDLAYLHEAAKELTSLSSSAGKPLSGISTFSTDWKTAIKSGNLQKVVDWLSAAKSKGYLLGGDPHITNPQYLLVARGSGATPPSVSSRIGGWNALSSWSHEGFSADNPITLAKVNSLFSTFNNTIGGYQGDLACSCGHIYLTGTGHHYLDGSWSYDDQLSYKWNDGSIATKPSTTDEYGGVYLHRHDWISSGTPHYETWDVDNISFQQWDTLIRDSVIHIDVHFLASKGSSTDGSTWNYNYALYRATFNFKNGIIDQSVSDFKSHLQSMLNSVSYPNPSAPYKVENVRTGGQIDERIRITPNYYTY